MSSMVSNLQFKAFTAAAISALAFGSPSSAQSGANGDGTTLVAQQPSEMQAAIAKWELLQSNRQLGFFDYAPFAMAYPDFPRTQIIRIRAENRLDDEAPSNAEILNFFDAHPPLTNKGRARYALALAASNRPEATERARAAWRGGEMSEPAEA